MSLLDSPAQLLLLLRASAAEDAASTLAPVLNATAYEVRLRLAAAKRGPAVLAVSQRREEVDAWVVELRALGLMAMRVDRARLLERSRIDVRDWRLAEGVLTVSGTGGAGAEIRLAELEGVVQALAVERVVERRVTSRRKLALGRAIASGGLMLTKKENQVQTFHHVDPQHRLAFYPREALPLIWMAEERIRYGALPRPLAPSRGANFARVVALVRAQLQPDTVYDEELLDHRRVPALLGPASGSSDDLRLAMGLIAEARRRSANTEA